MERLILTIGDPLAGLRLDRERRAAHFPR